MIARITRYKNFDAVALVHVGPDLAHVMGAFPSARWHPQERAYLERVEALGPVVAALEAAGAAVLDERAEPPVGVRCPACEAKPGNPCVNRSNGQPLGFDHHERLAADPAAWVAAAEKREREHGERRQREAGS